MSLGITPTKQRGFEIAPLDADGHRWALLRDGVSIFTGSREDCRARLALLTRPDDRERQDQALGRAVERVV